MLRLLLQWSWNSSSEVDRTARVVFFVWLALVTHHAVSRLATLQRFMRRDEPPCIVER